MNPDAVKEALIEIIKVIQEKSVLECPPLDGETIPHQDVPKFDSKIAIAATSKLAQVLDVEIPEDANIFANENNKSMLTIDQTVALVCALSNPSEQSSMSA